MSMAKISSFYDAAYLISVDVPITKMQREYNKTYFYFDDENFVKQELEIFHSDADLQLFVRGIVTLRRMLREKREEQQKNPELIKIRLDKNTDSAEKANTTYIPGNHNYENPE